MTTIGSLFTGYGGLDMGVAMAIDPAARVAWTSDIEPGPCKLAATRWPDTPNLGDTTKINWADVEPFDPTTPPRRQTTAQHTVRRMAHGPTRRPRHRPRPST